MPTSIALDTSPSTLEPLKSRGRDRDRFSDARDDCPVCIRVRARSAPDQLSIQDRTIYTGERLAAVNRALAAAAADHAASEPYGLGSPSFEDKDKEVARFRLLQRNIRTSSHGVETLPNPNSTASTPRSRVGSMTMSLSSASSSRPSSEHSGYSIDISKWKNVETLEFRARFTLVQGPHPGIWQYHVTDDWSNAEAWIPATPKFRRIANAVARLFTRRNSAGSAAGDEDSNQDKHSLGVGAADGDAFKTSRQLPGPKTRTRPVSWILK